MTLQCVDTDEDLELWQDEDCFFVRFERDFGGGSSLMFAIHEGQIFSQKEGREMDLSDIQYQTVEAWREEFE